MLFTSSQKCVVGISYEKHNTGFGLRVNMTNQRISGIAVSEDNDNILVYILRFAFNNNGETFTAFIVVKQLNLMIHDSPPFQRRHTIS